MRWRDREEKAATGLGVGQENFLRLRRFSPVDGGATEFQVVLATARVRIRV